MKLLREFPEDMPVFNGARHVHAQVATAVRGPHEGRKVLHLTFADTPAEGTFEDASARILEATGCGGQRELAARLDVPESEISDSRRWGIVSEKILLALVEQFQVNPQWVRTGEGDKLLIPYEPGSTLIWGTSTEPQRKLARIDVLCRIYDAGRGIWKQIDENRELLEFLLKEAPELMRRAPFIEAWIGDTDIFLECLQEHAPEFLERCRWVEGWLATQDAFLCSLQKLLELPDTPEGSYRFPRPWPGAVRYDAKTVDGMRDWLMGISRTDEGKN